MEIHQSDADRFWAKVERAGANECWMWTASTQRGYGAFRMTEASGRRQVNAHRVAYAIANGGLEDTDHVMHSCDEPLCCNPGHLSAGSRFDNMADAASKGRMSAGKPSPGLLGAMEKAEMREMFVSGVPIRAIARNTGHAAATVRRVVRDLREPSAMNPDTGEVGVPLRAAL